MAEHRISILTLMVPRSFMFAHLTRLPHILLKSLLQSL